RCSLSESGSHLPGTNEEPARSFNVIGDVFLRQRPIELFSRKWRKPYLLNQFFFLVSQYSEEIRHVAIDVIVRFNRRWFPIEEHRSRTCKRLYIMMAGW